MADPLVEGVHQFQNSVFPQKVGLFERLANGQQPHTAFVTCSDSRIDPFMLTSSQPGDIFEIRTAGNIVPPKGGPARGVTATIEYAVRVLKVANIVVCGHARCGAMDAATRPETVKDLDEIRSWIEESGAAAEMEGLASDEDRVEKAAKRNVRRQLENLKTYDFVQRAVSSGDLTLIGWYYDFVTGTVERFDPKTSEYVKI